MVISFIKTSIPLADVKIRVLNLMSKIYKKDGNYYIGIHTISDNKVYSIDGPIIRNNGDIENLNTGLYIINGKKVLVK